MKALLTTLGAGALIVSLAANTPLRADEDCDNVTKALEEAISIALKNFDQTMADLKKIMSEPADDKKKAVVKNTFCSTSGEFLGVSRASRAVAEVWREERRHRLVRQVDQGDGVPRSNL